MKKKEHAYKKYKNVVAVQSDLKDHKNCILEVVYYLHHFLAFIKKNPICKTTDFNPYVIHKHRRILVFSILRAHCMVASGENILFNLLIHKYIL